MTRLWPGLLLVGCTVGARPPGAELLGDYVLHATPTTRDCALSSVAFSEFGFEVSLSRTPGTTTAWVTLAGANRDATWDGQRVMSTASAPRSFAECASCAMALDETLELALLSASQSAAVGETCPLDGLVPAADLDAGIVTPTPNAYGYDSVRACGTLVTATRVVGQSSDGTACPSECSGCTMWYRVTGVRR